MIIIARESGEAGENAYEYAITREGSDCLIVMCIVHPDGTRSDYESACMGRVDNFDQARQRFCEKVSPGRHTLAISDDATRDLYETLQARATAEREAREAQERQEREAREAQERKTAERRQTIWMAYAYDPPKFKRQTVRLAIDEKKYPDFDPNVQAMVYKGLALHKPIDLSRYGGNVYQITHAKSGLSVARGFHSLEEARIACWRLAQLTDWTQDSETVALDVDQKKARAIAGKTRMPKRESNFYLDPAALEAGRDYLVMPSPGRYVRVTVIDVVDKPKARFAKIRLSDGHEQIWRKDRFLKKRPAPATKIERLQRGERVIASDADMLEFEALPEAPRLASIPNPDRVGILDAYIAFLKERPSCATN